jgi:hypothetical protein
VTPDELVRLAGTVLEAEAVYATEDGVWSGRASLTYRHRAKVDANSIRQLGVGEAVIVSRGRAARLLVLPPTAQPTDPRHPCAASTISLRSTGSAGRWLTPHGDPGSEKWASWEGCLPKGSHAIEQPYRIRPARIVPTYWELGIRSPSARLQPV